MKYYYGNSMKEALSCAPVTIKSTRILEQYKENYNVVISDDDEEFGCGDDYKEVDITNHDSKLSEML